MAWNIAERFPSWGETGEFPAAGFFYEGGDQVNEKHLDALWNGVNGLEEDIQAALNDIDSNADGVVDKAESGAAGFDLDGDLLAAGGEVLWDESENYIPQPRLQNDTITVNANDGLDGGGATALGSSFSVSVDVTDILATGITEDGSNNLELDESVLKDGGAKELDAAELAGDDGTNGQVLQTDGTSANWIDIPVGVDVSHDGTLVVDSAGDVNFTNGLTATDDGDGTASVNADEAASAFAHVMSYTN
jgi:hypothetical protein